MWLLKRLKLQIAWRGTEQLLLSVREEIAELFPIITQEFFKVS